MVSAFGKRACVVTANSDDADLGEVFKVGCSHEGRSMLAPLFRSPITAAPCAPAPTSALPCPPLGAGPRPGDHQQQPHPGVRAQLHILGAPALLQEEEEGGVERVRKGEEREGEGEAAPCLPPLPLRLSPSTSTQGNHRKLRVAAQPNVTLTVAHLPPRCRRARVLLLGPLMPEDLDPQGFVQLAARPWWHRALGLPVQRVGLMAQGLQRALEGGGRVRQQAQPSPQLVDSLGPSTLVFLSDVETEVWANGTVAELAARTSRFLVTRGKDGADEWRRGALRHVPVWEVRLWLGTEGACYSCGASVRHLRAPAAHPAAFPPSTHLKLSCVACTVQVEQVVDTNGAGDTFATAYMLAEAAGHSSPISVAHWAGGLAVGQPQACKPACVTTALQAGWASRPVSQRGLAWPTMHRLLLPPLQHAARMLGLAQGGSAAAAA